MNDKSNLSKIAVLGIIILVLVVAGFSIWFFNTTKKITTYEECVKAGWLVRSRMHYDGFERFGTKYECVLWGGKSFEKHEGGQEVDEARAIEAIKEFRAMLENYRIIKRKPYDRRYELIDKQTLPASFSFYQEATAEPVVKKYVSVFRDDECFDWQINEYEVNIETNEVVSMRPVDQTSCWFPSLGERLYKEITDEQDGTQKVAMVRWQYDDLAKPPLSDEELKQTAIDFLTDLLGSAEFDKIESNFDFDYGSNYDKGNYWGNYFFGWLDNNYRPPIGCASLMQPFIYVGITKSGHIFSYENTTSFFEDLPSNCETPN